MDKPSEPIHGLIEPIHGPAKPIHGPPPPSLTAGSGLTPPDPASPTLANPPLGAPPPNLPCLGEPPLDPQRSRCRPRLPSDPPHPPPPPPTAEVEMPRWWRRSSLPLAPCSERERERDSERETLYHNQSIGSEKGSL
jgi:hypothetical protein